MTLMRRVRYAIGLAIFSVVLALAPCMAQGGAEGEIQLAGQPLADGLRALQQWGLQIFFTSHLVREDMRIDQQPTSVDPRAVLDEILAPHGLKVVAGPGGRLVVVAGVQEPARLRGVAVDRVSGRAIEGVQILLPDLKKQNRTGLDGSFEIGGVPAGRHRLEARLPGYVVEHFEMTVRAGETSETTVRLEIAPVALDEIVVTPSRISLLQENPVSALDLDRDDIFALPHYGDDIFRALSLLPGVAGEDASARFNVRGGRSDEVLVLLDKVELFEPYHLKDYSSRISIIAPRTLREVNLITGGFPAQYGDRMSGVLEMRSEEPRQLRTVAGVGILNAELGSSGAFGASRGHWVASLRRSNLDVALDLLDIREKPKYWDAFGKMEYRFKPGHLVGAHVLHSDDSLDFSNVDVGDDVETYLTSYNNSYAWLTHQSILSPRLFVNSALSAGRVERDRRGTELELDAEDGDGFDLVDRRRLEVVGFKQDWSFEAAERHFVRWGFEARQLETEYDYLNLRQLEDPLETYRVMPRTGLTRLRTRLEGDQYSFYVSDRWRPVDAVVLELGVRYDEQNLTADRNVSPRINLVYGLGASSTLRAAWGYFYQSQRPYELQVEDGVTVLAAAERTEQRVLGFEKSWLRADSSDLTLRLEAYERHISNPRPRYENIFEPISIFPEIETDRVLIAPSRSEGYGFEASLRGSLGAVDWWLSYTYSRIFDRIDGRDVPRRFDQPHAVKVDVNFKAWRHWNVNFAWRYHTGWPTTRFGSELEEDDEGEPELSLFLGPLYAERLADYHRLDVRLSREWQRRNGVLGFFLEVQNLYDRRNQAGFDSDFETAETDTGDIVLEVKEEKWDGFLPSFGISWQF